MASERLVPTRSTLLRARAQLERVRQGADAVSRKRQALVTHLMNLARPAMSARVEIARLASEAADELLDAAGANGIDALRGIARPAANVEVDVEPTQIWGVPVADVAPVSQVRRTLEARGTPPGSTGEEAMDTAHAYEALVELLIQSAPNELRVSRLAEAVATTSRQLRLLRERVEPRLVGQIADVARTLEEREREEHVRLKHLQRRIPTS